MSQSALILSILGDVSGIQVSKLTQFESELGKFLSDNFIDGWLYYWKGNYFLPYAVTDIRRRSTSDDKEYLEMVLKANSIKESRSDTKVLSFFSEDLGKRTIPEILASRSFMKETKELKETYVEDMEQFRVLRGLENKQLVLKYNKSIRLINDETSIERVYIPSISSKLWSTLNNKEEIKLPVHPTIYCFNLITHDFQIYHSSRLQEYIYNPELEKKLILSNEHKDLIDILVTDLNLLQEDLIEGKSGGTTILCKGAPGLGKTLSAEIYSEKSKRPLYRVHSGILGTSAEEVEKNKINEVIISINCRA